MPDTYYMQSTLGGQKSLVAQMALIPKIRSIVNYDRIISYTRRVTDYGRKTANDPCVTPDTRETSACTPYPSGVGCSYYRITWGPDWATGDCIKVAVPPYTQTGRFATQDKTPVSVSYSAGQVESNWTTLLSLFEEIPVPDPEPTCYDGVQNGTETGVDCGGSCSACPSGTVGTFLPFKSNGKATRAPQ